MELALQVVGLKMTGRIEQAKNVAMHIVGNSSLRGNVNSLSTGRMSPINSLSWCKHHSSFCTLRTTLSLFRQHCTLFAHSATRYFLSVMIEFLGSLDINVPTSSTVSAREAVPHACHRDRRCFVPAVHWLFGHLIQRGIDVDARDANGYYIFLLF